MSYQQKEQKLIDRQLVYPFKPQKMLNFMNTIQENNNKKDAEFHILWLSIFKFQTLITMELSAHEVIHTLSFTFGSKFLATKF